MDALRAALSAPSPSKAHQKCASLSQSSVVTSLTTRVDQQQQVRFLRLIKRRYRCFFGSGSRITAKSPLILRAAHCLGGINASSGKIKSRIRG